MKKEKELKKYTEEFINRLNDVKFIGQLLFVVIVLLISWSGVKAIESNYNLQKQITSLKQQNEIQKLQNSNLQLENQYYNSNQYIELSARQNFGLADPNEKEVIIPTQVALANTINLPTTNYQSLTESKKSKLQNNFESWVNFLLDRNK
jgi:cell division protein FtsL